MFLLGTKVEPSTYRFIAIIRKEGESKQLFYTEKCVSVHTSSKKIRRRAHCLVIRVMKIEHYIQNSHIQYVIEVIRGVT